MLVGVTHAHTVQLSARTDDGTKLEGLTSSELIIFLTRIFGYYNNQNMVNHLIREYHMISFDRLSDD